MVRVHNKTLLLSHFYGSELMRYKLEHGVGVVPPDPRKLSDIFETAQVCALPDWLFKAMNKSKEESLKDQLITLDVEIESLDEAWDVSGCSHEGTTGRGWMPFLLVAEPHLTKERRLWIPLDSYLPLTFVHGAGEVQEAESTMRADS